MMKKDVFTLWEQEGDLERMKFFFQNVDSGLEQKERIKQLALKKISAEEQHSAEHDAFQIGTTIPGFLSSESDKLLDRARRGIKSLWWRWHWKLAVPAVALILMIFLGHEGLNQFLDSPLAKGKATQSQSTNQMTAELYDRAGSASKKEAAPTSPVENYSFSSGEAPAVANDAALSQAIPPDNPNIRNKASIGIVPPLPGPVQPTTPPADESLPKKITYNMSANLQVEDVNLALERITQEVKNSGGYVVESQQDLYQNSSNAHATLKIPSTHLEGFRKLLPEVGKILNQNTTANDITNQYYDTETRLRSWEAQETRYLEILKEAHTVDDILKIESALGNIRMQIEQLKGQLKLWDHEVSYSTIQLNLQTTPNPVSVDDPWQPVSWAKTWQAAKAAVLKTISTTWNGINYIFVGIAYTLPYLLLGGILFGIYKGIKKYRRK
jgi:hypothetical protein